MLLETVVSQERQPHPLKQNKSYLVLLQPLLNALRKTEYFQVPCENVSVHAMAQVPHFTSIAHFYVSHQNYKTYYFCLKVLV